MRLHAAKITILVVGFVVHTTAQAMPDSLGEGVKGPVMLSSLPNPTALLYLGYSRCAEYCPLALRTVERALSAEGAAAKECISILFVDMSDNDTDQPAATRRQNAQQFLDSFLAGGIAVVAADSQLRHTLLQALGAEVKPVTDPDPLVATRYSHARS